MTLSTKVRTVAALGTLSAAVWAGTFAAFTDSGTSTTTFTAGTVDLELADEADDAYAFTSLALGNMKPGDVVYAPLKVENAGTLDLLLDLSVDTTNADGKGLGAQLQMGAEVVTDAATCSAVGYAAAAASALPDLTSVAEGSMASRTVTDRSIAAGTAEVWCVKVQLPLSSGNTFQAATTTATLTFNADQA